ncbi:MAG: membrane protein insertion efficiency factor YidD [Planctomycetota bacterium]
MPEPGRLARWAAWPMMASVWGYRITLSPLLGGQCRFEPTCSRYALAALRDHGAWHGARLTLIRLSKCHPLHRGGYDPSPPPGEPPVPFRTLDVEEGVESDSGPPEEGKDVASP